MKKERSIMKPAKTYYLSDLDTAFPRDTSLCLKLIFENGRVNHINSNYSSIEEFKERWIGKTVYLCLYEKHRDKFTAISKLVDVE